MTYSFVKISAYNNKFLEHYYLHNPGISDLDYIKQYNHLMAQGIAWANYFEIHFKESGIEAYEIVSNAIPLQQTWAKENGFNKQGKELIIEQLKILKPTIIFIQDIGITDRGFLQSIKENLPSIKKIFALYSSPAPDKVFDRFKYVDVVLSVLPQFSDQLIKAGLKNYPFVHAFEHTLVPLLKLENYFLESDLIFIGSLIESKDYHNNRVEILNQLIEKDLNIKLIISNLNNDPFIFLKFKQAAFLLNKISRVLGITNFTDKSEVFRKINALKSIPRNVKISEKLKKQLSFETVYGIHMLRLLTSSKIGFNIHGGITGDYAANIRMFEVTGAGSCLITDYKKNMHELFDLNNEVVTYKSVPECIDKIRWLINNPLKTKEIALAGQKRTLKEHTIKNRVLYLDEIIRKELSS